MDQALVTEPGVRQPVELHPAQNSPRVLADVLRKVADRYEAVENVVSHDTFLRERMQMPPLVRATTSIRHPFQESTCGPEQSALEPDALSGPSDTAAVSGYRPAANGKGQNTTFSEKLWITS
jgi:hypothetical protein